MERIIVADDEQKIRKLVGDFLRKSGYSVLEAENGDEAYSLFIENKNSINLLILDIMMPGLNGWEVTRKIRESSDVPVILLSARSEEFDVLTGYENGADDYVTKPFSSAELLARIRMTLRNYRHSADSGKLPGGKFKVRDLAIDYDARQVFIGDEEIKLSQTEYNIVALLSEHCGKMMSYSAIIKGVWGYSNEGSTKKLQVNMANIRKKFGVKPGEARYITNELGVGYRMNGDKDE